MAGQHFHPLNKSSNAMFYRSHDKYMNKLHAFVDMMNGPNPMTEDDLKRLQKRFPGRYDDLKIPRK